MSYINEQSDVSYDINKLNVLNTIFSSVNRGTNLTDDLLAKIGFYDNEGKFNITSTVFVDNYNGKLLDIRYTVYKGCERNSEKIYEKLFSGDFIQLLASIQGFSDAFVIQNGYTKSSFTEGVINAVAHKDYSKTNPIEVELFTDRIEITSSGSLVKEEMDGSYSITNIEYCVRNPVLCSVLKLIGIVGMNGSGYKIISQDYENMDELHTPFVTSIKNDKTILVLPNPSYEKGLVNRPILKESEREEKKL